MTDYSSFQLPPPTDWQAFERLCHALWIRLWSDPNAQQNGRSGQRQVGVDIYGTPAGSSRPHGIQCKSKDLLLGSRLTQAEVLAEVEEAKKFLPPLAELIIATSAESDAELQALARRTTQEHRAVGRFDVHVYGWKEIVARLVQFSDLVDRFYGTQFPSGGVVLNAETEERLTRRHAEVQSGQLEISQQITQIAAAVARPADGPAHAQLDMCRDLIDAHAYRTVLPMLEKIREREWSGANSALRFRIATNLGAAHLGLGHYDKAGKLFIEAFEFEPSSDKAVANRALGHLLIDQRAEALAAARQAVERYPSSARAWVALINIMPRVEPGMIIPDVPAELADDPQLLQVRADALSMRKAWPEAEALLRQLVTLKPNEGIPKSLLAEVLLAQATGGGRFYAGASYSESDTARLSEAKALLQQSWAEMKQSDLAIGSLHVVQNLCSLSIVLGSMREVESVVDEALTVVSDDPGLLGWKVRLSAIRSDGAAATQALAKLPRGSTEEYALIEASALRASNNPAAAIEVLEEFIRKTGTTEVTNDARCLLADLLCDSDLARAEERLNSLPEAGSKAVVRSTIIFARALREKEQPEAANRYLQIARAQLKEEGDSRDQLMLADALADFEDYGGAASIYERWVSMAIDTPSLREYLRCLFELDQRQRLTTLLASLPSELASKPHYQYVRANLSIRSGDLLTGRALLEQCLVAEPKHKAPRFLWADICLRTGDTQSVADWLAAIDVRSTDLTLDQLLRLGPMFHALGQAERAIELFYQALRRFPHDPRPHLAFTASMLFKSDGNWAVPPGMVDIDTACELEDENGRKTVYVIETLPQSELLPQEVLVSSSIGQRLMGRKVDDLVTFHSSTLATHESTVASIQHKYVHRLHESMATFNTRFPESRGMVGLRIPTSGTAEEQLAPIKRAMKDKAEATKRVLESYRQGMPIAALGVLTGRTSIEAWQGLAGNSDLPILVCSGSAAERSDAFALLQKDGQRYILDPIALAQLHAMDAVEAVEAVCGRLAITQATIEELRGLLRELELHPNGYTTVFEHNGEYLRNEISTEAVENERRKLQSLLERVQSRCDVAPAVPRADLKPSMAEGLHEVLGAATYDTLLAAHGSDLILVSDDWNLRRLAKGELKIPSVWIQPILMRAHDAGLVQSPQYHRATSLLVGWQHRFTSVSPELLLFVAAQDSWKVTALFTAIASILSLDRSEVLSSAQVVLGFLRALWGSQSPAPRQDAATLTAAVLQGVDPGRSQENVRFFRLLEHAAGMGHLPKDPWRAIHDWYGNHFLAPVFSIDTPWGRSR